MRLDVLFEVLTRDGRQIRLTQKQWLHISQRHPEMSGLIEEMQQALIYPTHVLHFSNETIKYYLFLKNKMSYILKALNIRTFLSAFVYTNAI